MVKIYTKTGDTGNTKLANSKSVRKSDLRIEAYGQIDEVNALLGFAISSVKKTLTNSQNNASRQTQALLQECSRIQGELFWLGSELALASGLTHPIGRDHIEDLERSIDKMEESLQPLKHFILPGGSEAASAIHLVRVAVRRAERSLVKLKDVEAVRAVRDEALIYLNRLSDYFFVVARYVLKLESIPEVIWKGRT